MHIHKKTSPQTLGVKYGFDIFTICSTKIGEKNMNKQKYKYKCNKIYTLHKTITLSSQRHFSLRHLCNTQ